MSAMEWIVCERTGRWAAALRTAFARQAKADDWLNLREVRSLNELDAQIAEKQFPFVLIEVTADNLEPVLTWLADEARSSRAVRTVALLSDDLVKAVGWDREPNRSCRQHVEDALFEAGVLEIAHSPRRLQHVLSLGRQCAAGDARRAETLRPHESLADWAWAQLPWQDAP